MGVEEGERCRNVFLFRLSADLRNDYDAQEGRYKVIWEREFKLPWREAGPPNYLDDKVDSDQ